MPHPISTPLRIACALVALTALSSIAVQFTANWVQDGAAANTREILWRMARYFTHLANAMVGIVLGLTAIRGRWTGPGWPAAITVWILAVGVVYHLLLAAQHNPKGLEVWSSFGEHSVVPLACLVLWIIAAPKQGLGLHHPLIWTVFPLAYAVYAILRGNSDGIYPYFFLNPAKSGIPVVAAYVAGLGVFFVLCGWALVLAARFGRSAAKS